MYVCMYVCMYYVNMRLDQMAHCNIVPLHQLCMYVCMYVCMHLIDLIFRNVAKVHEQASDGILRRSDEYGLALIDGVGHDHVGIVRDGATHTVLQTLRLRKLPTYIKCTNVCMSVITQL